MQLPFVGLHRVDVVALLGQSRREVRFAGFQGAPEGGDDLLGDGFRPDDPQGLGKIPSDQRLHIGEDRPRAGVHLGDPESRIHGVNAERRVLDKREERFMDAAKLRFRALARADVAHKRREHRRAGRRDPRYRQLNGELHAVRSQRGQFNPPVENRPLAGFQVMGKPLTVTLTIGWRDKECREFAAEHILAPVTKGALGGAIELRNHPVVGNADDAIQGRFERSAFARLALAQQSLAHTHGSCGPQQQRRQQADFDNRPDRRAQRGIHPAPLLCDDSQTAQGHWKHDDKRQNMAHENPGRAVLEQRLHYTALGDADDKADAQRENHRRSLQGNAGQAQSIGFLGAIDVADDREQSDRRHRHAHSGGNASPARRAWQQHQRAADEQERHRSRHAHAPG